MNAGKQHIDEKDRKRKGIIVTICVHLCFIACFILFGFKVIDPKKGTTELTWEVQGITDAGGKSQENPTAEKPSTDQENQQTAAASSQASDDEKLISDESSEVAIKSSPKKAKKAPADVTNTKKEESTDTKTEESPSDDLKNMMANYNKGKNSKTGNSGPGNKKGKAGNENTNGNDATGNKGAGNGKYDISGRIATKLGTQRNDCGESGTVVIKIIVNQAGIVTEAIHVDGTTSNKCLINQAKLFAKQIKYAPSKVGESKTNEGRITIKGSLN
jgi:hypothetical protein